MTHRNRLLPLAILSLLFPLLGCSTHPGLHFSSSGQERLSPEGRRSFLADCVKITTLSGSGSGLRLYDRLILTANHVILDNFQVVEGIILADGAPYRFYRSDPTSDLALIEDSSCTIGSRDWGSPRWGGLGRPESGDECWMAGYPLGKGPYLTSGYWTTPADEPGFSLISCPGMPGSSGSGIVDRQGRLVGVLQQGYTREDQPVPFMLLSCDPAKLSAFLSDIPHRRS